MKGFTKFLVEKAMAYDDALKVLGLKSGFTADELSNAHKEAVRKYHPDRPGGDANKMVQANNARDALRGAGTAARVTSTYSRADYQAMEEKRKAFAQIAKDAADKHLQIEPFVQHFNTIFGEQFYATKRQWRLDNPTVAAYDAEFANKARTIVLSFGLYIDYMELWNSRSLADVDSGLRMSIISDILYNRKKVKLTQSNYRMDREYKVLYDPEVLFPSAKLKTQAEKSVSRKMSRRDVLLTFEKELGATNQGSGNDIWVYVPVGNYKVALYRMTMMGGASWGINGIYEKHKRVIVPNLFVSFIEDDISMNFLMNAFRDLQQHPPDNPVALGFSLEAMMRNYKATRSAL